MHLPLFCYRFCATRLFFLGSLVLASQISDAATLPASTPVEVRLSAASGTRISHVGDPVDATVIAPVYADGRLVIPQGAVVSGVIDQVGKLGFGLKHVTSDLDYRFDNLRLPNGTEVAIDADVMQVETAKERVNADGLVKGIYPTANISAPIVSYLFPLAWVEPHFGLPFLGIKVVIARSPDPEIYFPAGTEFVLRLNAEASVPNAVDGTKRLAELSTQDLASVHRLLEKLPEQHTNRGRNHPSDLVNVMFLGNRDAINRAFHAAGWAGAQRSSLMTIYRMYHCMVQRMGYSTAPMIRLTLNGLRADEDYQKGLNTFAKRHHIRLWKQGEDDIWLSAATEDVSFRVRNMHLTHATDPAIDNERNKVVNDVAFTGCLESGAMVPRTTADQAESSIQTDGDLAVLRLNDCMQPRTVVNESGAPTFRPKPRALQALLAFRNDVIRNNPVFLVYNSVKLLCGRHSSGENQAGFLSRLRRERQGALETAARNAWSRPSVLDLQLHAN